MILKQLRTPSLLVAFIAPGLLAQTTQVSPRDAMRESGAVLMWSQQQKETGFRAMDSIFPSAIVHHGTRPHEWRTGAPLAAFTPGGARAAYLNQFIAEQKVAGLLVLHDGAIRLERYGLGQTAAGHWTSFSVAKSITSTLVGAAIKDGYIKGIDEPVTKYITQLKGSAYDGVTIQQLLTMTSGVRWNEDYTDMKSDIALLYSTTADSGVDANVSYVRKLPRESPAGTKWVYKTVETNLVGVLVMEATKKPLAQYLSEKIWGPYGMERDAAWMIDAIGHEQGGCCLSATLRDFARYGQFVIDGMKVNGTSIVPDWWLDAATHKQAETGGAGAGYGYQWWTTDDGTFDARGIFGQAIHIDPKRKLVIVINSAWTAPTGRAQSQARAQVFREITAAIDAEAGKSRW